MAWSSGSGSLGVDHSANAAAVPLAGYTLLATVATNLRRNFVEVQNQSTDLLQLVRDNPAPTGDGAQVTTMMLAAATVAGGQGGGWASGTFKGRLRVYGPNASDQVAAYED